MPDKPAPDAAEAPDARADGAALTPDAAVPDAGCPISAGVTPVLDGLNDVADYPAAQQLTPGAMLGADGAAISWDAQRLYITVQSAAFAQPYEPLHV